MIIKPVEHTKGFVPAGACALAGDSSGFLPAGCPCSRRHSAYQRRDYFKKTMLCKDLPQSPKGTLG